VMEFITNNLIQVNALILALQFQSSIMETQQLDIAQSYAHQDILLLMILIDALLIVQLHLLNLLICYSKIIRIENACQLVLILNLMHILYLQTEIVMLFAQQELMRLMRKIEDVLVLALITQLINFMHTTENVFQYVPLVIGQTLLL
jgi:hypothetical protein